MRLSAFVLFVKDIEKAKRFYTNTLGLKIIYDFGTNITLDQNIGLWQVSDGHTIDKELDTTTPANRSELYFEAEDIDAYYQQLKEHKVSFFQHLHEEPWGQRTFRFFDPDLHLIEVGEPLNVFVNNLKRNGLSDEAISTKTGIPLKNVRVLLD